jgi:hypothetical protein
MLYGVLPDERTGLYFFRTVHCRSYDCILVSNLRLLCSVSVASYDSQDYGWDILTRLHTARAPTKSKSKVILRKMVSRPVCFGVRHPSGSRDELFSFFLYFFIDSYGFVDVGALSDEKSGL